MIEVIRNAASEYSQESHFITIYMVMYKLVVFIKEKSRVY